MRDGDTVLVLGASGVVGRIAVRAAKLLGAGHVVAAARSEEGLSRAGELGADAAVKLELGRRPGSGPFRDAAIGGIDVIIDPLWGAPAAAAQYRPRAQGRGRSPARPVGRRRGHDPVGCRARPERSRSSGTPTRRAQRAPGRPAAAGSSAHRVRRAGEPWRSTPCPPRSATSSRTRPW
ncbi:MAG: zinc-binding dehydrogenase [Thermoleophilaceae bacterium]